MTSEHQELHHCIAKCTEVLSDLTIKLALAKVRGEEASRETTLMEIQILEVRRLMETARFGLALDRFDSEIEKRQALIALH